MKRMLLSLCQVLLLIKKRTGLGMAAVIMTGSLNRNPVIEGLPLPMIFRFLTGYLQTLMTGQ